MSTGDTQQDPTGGRIPASEEELRAAYEAEIKKIRVEQVLLENIVTMVNLGMRRTGLAPGTEDERDLPQVQVAIDSIRALLPIVEQSAGPQAGPIRDALSQLQLAFVKLGGGPETPGESGPGDAGSGSEPGGPGGPSGPGGSGGPSGPGGSGGPSEPAAPKPGEPGPAQRSGRLWVPGQ